MSPPSLKLWRVRLVSLDSGRGRWTDGGGLWTVGEALRLENPTREGIEGEVESRRKGAGAVRHEEVRGKPSVAEAMAGSSRFSGLAKRTADCGLYASKIRLGRGIEGEVEGRKSKVA